MTEASSSTVCKEIPFNSAEYSKWEFTYTSDGINKSKLVKLDGSDISWGIKSLKIEKVKTYDLTTTTPVVGLTGSGTDSIKSIGFILYDSTRCYTEYRNCPGFDIADEPAYWCYNP